MDLSRKWLSEFVELSDVDDKTFSEEMTLSGSKVELVNVPGDRIRNVVVGRVTAMERHPDSDHMWICTVDVGSETLQIVTGAQNVHEGDLVPVAKDGSLLPGGVEIHAGKLRGVDSVGMLCSLKELGLTLHDFPYAIEDGIWVLQEDCRPGDDIRPILGADDHIVEFEITPNRPDCLSVIGLAREAAATFRRPLQLHEPVVRGGAGSIAGCCRIEIEDAALCPRYTARMVKNVKIAPSPAWMRERLRNSGVRPINNIVDITNYVMLEYGQPMHAFDFSCVEGGKIVVRRARAGETIQNLDGGDRKLTEDMLCICDENRPVAVAGVMGGANSEIVGDTAMVLFESANFDGTSVRRTAAALGMRTEASARFEKGLDPMGTVRAVNRACELVELLGAGEVMDGIVDACPVPMSLRTLPLDPEKINALLGTDLSAETMKGYLRGVGFEIDETDLVTVPSWRGDVEHYSDLAEEVARFYGYNNIPTTLMCGATCCGGRNEQLRAKDALGDVCRALGFDEIITYSFVSPSSLDRIRIPEDSPLRRPYRIKNPLGEDTSVMRTSVLPSMLDILVRNLSYRNERAWLYEIAKVYNRREDGLADEPRVVSLGAYGGGMDFFRLKGVIERLLACLRIDNVRFAAEKANPSYHPGRCARVYAGSVELGVFGQLHPLAAKNYGVDEALYCAELSFEKLLSVRGAEPEYTPLPKFPAVTRDIAVVCPDTLPAAVLLDTIRSAGGRYLESARLFDVYTGAPIPEGFKSMAFSLKLRAPDMTLTDEHADEAVAAVLKALHEQHGASIR